MFFSCCATNTKIIPQEIAIEMDKIRAEKYGISIERYNRILSLPQMTRYKVETLYNNGWDFTDMSLDLQLFAEMQTFCLESIPEQKNED